MKNEDVLKTNFVGVKFSSDENFDLNLACKNAGEDRSEYIREAVKQRMERENGDFLKKRKKQLQEELEKIKEQEKLMDQKKSDFKKIPEKEFEWLLETKQILTNQPEFLDGRLRAYQTKFPKPYNTSKAEFFKLLEEVDVQQILRENKPIEAQS